MRRWTFGLVLLLRAAGAREAFSTGDLWRWREAHDARIRPDGQMIVYTEVRQDRARDRGFSNLWLVRSGDTPVEWTKGEWRDRSPRWSPEGERIAWISDRKGIFRLYVRRVAGGDEIPITEGGLEPLEFAWSGDGKWLAYTARVEPPAPSPAWAPESILPLLERPRAGFTHLFVVPANGSAPARQITRGEFDCVGAPAWSADGRSIVVARGGDIASVAVADGSVRVLTKSPGRYSEPLVSPDGGRIAYLAADPKPQSYTLRRLFVMNADGSRVRALAGTLDRDIESPQWSPDSRAVYFLAEDRGVTRVYAARNDGTSRVVARPPERLYGLSVADNGRAASVRLAAADAGSVVTFPVDVEGPGAVAASPNAALLAEREAGDVEEISYPSAGQSIQGWIVKPPRFDASRKYPLLVDIQDDPRAMCGVEFRLRAQIVAAKGFVVLCANPRGTPGYGEQFGLLLRSRYPGDDFDDLLHGAEFLAARPYIDGARMAVAGGLVAAWAIGHTDRFRAAVIRRPIVDWGIHVTTAPDGARRAAEWMGGFPWEDPEQYVKHSPLYFAQNFKTPSLVIAAGPDAASDALYFALRERKVDAALVRLPGTGSPSEVVMELDAALAWLAR